MAITNIISDMDGVMYRGNQLIPGAKEFVQRLLHFNIPFLFLTNNSEQTPIDLKLRFESMGLDGLQENNFITPAMATSDFLHSQKPGSTAYVLGGGGMINELYKKGFSISERNPDYVVVGKTTSLNYDMIRKAVQFIMNGAKFIGTNPDVLDPTDSGFEEACGSSRPAGGSEHLIFHTYDNIPEKPSMHGLQVGVATVAVSWLQNNREFDTIKSVLEATGFVDYMKNNPLNKAEFIEAIKFAPNVKENYYTILSDGGNVQKLIEFVDTSSYFSNFLA